MSAQTDPPSRERMRREKGANKVVLNIQKLDALRARAGQPRTEYWDEGLRGFGVRVYATGKKVLTVRYSLRGKQLRKDIGVYRNDRGSRGGEIGYTDARAEAARILSEVGDGRDPFPAATKLRRAEIRDFGGVCERYVEVRVPELSDATRREFERLIRKEIIPAWGAAEPGAIGAEAIEDWARGIAGGVGRERPAPYLANRAFECLRLIFRWGMEVRLLTHTPFGSIRKPHVEESRDRVFANEELRRIFRALRTEPVQIAGLWLLLLYTGNRLRETLRIEWAWIDREDALLTLPRGVTKSKRTHVVPLVPGALTTMDMLKDLSGDSRYAFPGPTGDPMNWVQKACTRVMAAADVQDGRYHDTRRVVDTNLAKLGVGRDIRSLLLNHSVGGKLEKTYNAYDYIRERRQALSKWAKRLQQILGYEPTDVMRVERRGYQGKGPSRKLNKPDETWSERKLRLTAEGRDLLAEQREMRALKTNS